MRRTTERPPSAGASLHLRQWCGRRESNPHGFSPNGFSYHFDFRRRARARSWSGLSLHRSSRAVGATRLVSTPSRPSGLARDRHCSVPRLWAVLLPVFPPRHSITQVRCVYQFHHVRDGSAYCGVRRPVQVAVPYGPTPSARFWSAGQLRRMSIAEASRFVLILRRNNFRSSRRSSRNFGDVVDVRTLHQAHADIGMAEAVSRPAPLIAIEFEPLLLKDCVE